MSANAIKVLSDGYILAGSASYPEGNAWLARTNFDGDTLWTRSIGSNNQEVANDVLPTADGGFVLCGMLSRPLMDGEGAWLAKTDSLGNLLWEKTYEGVGGTATNTDVFFKIAGLAGGGYAIAGACDVHTHCWPFCYASLWLVTTNDAGDTVWTSKLQETTTTAAMGYNLMVLPDSQIIVAGSLLDIPANEADALVVKFGTSGNIVWQQSVDIPGGTSREAFYGLSAAGDNRFIAVGYSSQMLKSMVIASLFEDGSPNGINSRALVKPSPFFYPNPAGDHLILQHKSAAPIILCIVDITGKTVFEQKVHGSVVPLHDLSLGKYAVFIDGTFAGMLFKR